MSPPTLSPEEIIILLEHERLVNYMTVASMAILAFDYLLTLPLEIEYVWKSRFNVVNILYFITRYLPFIDISMVLYQEFRTTLSPEACLRTNKAFGWLYIIGFSVGEIILSLRTWAVCGMDRRLTVAFPIIYLGLMVPMYFNVYHVTKRFVILKLPISRPTGCILAGGGRELFYNWTITMAYDGG
ncbi:hypothetical protein AX17_003234 [Amanita inopinata Kibby_2008]|nr:hypothetical protein AX17_003234 [Amanita inopinata Kibby_2008]